MENKIKDNGNSPADHTQDLGDACGRQVGEQTDFS